MDASHNTFFSLTSLDDCPDMNKVKEAYGAVGAWGMLTSLDLKDCAPGKIRSKDVLHTYVLELCTLIDMKRFGDPQIVHFGHSEEVEGFSMTQLIETSLISGHFANKTNTAYLDIFSCKVYDPEKAAKFSQDFFEAKACFMNVLLRK